MKNKIFFSIMLIVSVLLLLLRFTGLTMHIVISVVGVLALIAFAVISRKEWKKPVLEILLRVLFAIAFISGILVMKLHDVTAFSIIHKVSAVCFTLMLLVMYIPKFFKKA